MWKSLSIPEGCRPHSFLLFKLILTSTIRGASPKGTGGEMFQEKRRSSTPLRTPWCTFGRCNVNQNLSEKSTLLHCQSSIGLSKRQPGNRFSLLRKEKVTTSSIIPESNSLLKLYSWKLANTKAGSVAERSFATDLAELSAVKKLLSLTEVTVGGL